MKKFTFEKKQLNSPVKSYYTIIKTVIINGKPERHPVKVYEPLIIEDYPNNPVYLTNGWSNGIKHTKLNSE